MNSDTKAIQMATRGSALALAQTDQVARRLREEFPQHQFSALILKTTGDKLQTASLANPQNVLAKGLFTKELESALLDHSADLAVHSLKDLPTELPDGLRLGAVCERADPRDVLILDTRKVPFDPTLPLHEWIRLLPPHFTVGTSSTRREAQMKTHRPDTRTVPIRGNVGTRLSKLSQSDELHGLLLASAGLDRLGFQTDRNGFLTGETVPEGLAVLRLDPEIMLPCPGQAAIGIEVRTQDSFIQTLCNPLNHPDTWDCISAERSFLAALGGGCQAPVGALASIEGDQLRLRTVSFLEGKTTRQEETGSRKDAFLLGQSLARRVQDVI